MMNPHCVTPRPFPEWVWFLILILILAGSSQARANPGKVKVFILAGQSNMEGYGMIGSLNHLGTHPQQGHLLAKIRKEDGSWAVRQDVTLYWNKEDKPKKHGPLSVDWGAMTGKSIGPELMFGTLMGERFEEHVLLIKTAWGGKSVWSDFRSPGAGPMTWNEKRILQRDDWMKPGLYYTNMLRDIRHCLKNISTIVPGYQGQGYEWGGLVWFQGFNDYSEWHLQLDGKHVGLGVIDRYRHNLTALFRDIRRELKAPNLPIVMGELGIRGLAIKNRARHPDDHEARALLAFRKAQRAVAQQPGLKNITFVPTAEFWDDRLQELRLMANEYWEVKQRNKIQDTDDNILPTKVLNDEYWRRGGHWEIHYNGSATTYCLIGQALARAFE